MFKAALSSMLSMAAVMFAQPASGPLPRGAEPQFEVASVKPSAPDAARKGSGSHSDNGRLTITNSTLKRCIMGAYGVGQNEITGGPDWLDQDQFDIAAKA